MKKLPIIALARTHWEDRWMNRQHLLSRLGKRGWQITYSNGAPFTWQLTQSLKKGGLFSTSKKQDSVTTYSSGLCIPRNYRLKALDDIAIKLHCRQLKRTAKIKEGEDFIVICFDPDFLPYVEELAPKYTALHIYDLYGKVDYGHDTGLLDAQLKRLIARSNLITTPTQYLLDTYACGHEHKSHVVHNSADSESIQSIESTFIEPSELAGIAPPRIGYLGAVNRKIDFSSLLAAAQNNCSWHFVIIGPINDQEIIASPQKDAFIEFKALENVHFIGEITKKQIPSFLLSMNANLMPFRDGEDCWSKYSYPLKLNEYLATGSPIVSSILPAVQQACGELVYFADSPEEWEQKIRQALNEDDPQLAASRKVYAKNNSWDRRVEQYEALVFSMFEE